MAELLVPAGFRFAAVTAGIKESGKPDLALAVSDPAATAAAMFTQNTVVAAPIVLGREHLTKSRGRVAAVLVNSGNANCATGEDGLRKARATSIALANELAVPASQVIVSSTGIIGVPLPVEKITTAIPALTGKLSASQQAASEFSHAILTTDTRAKTASQAITAGRQKVRIFGIAKGAGMIHPDMATMLVYLFTDAAASAAALDRHLRAVVHATLNSLSVDGDTSTNDTALLLASGASGVSVNSGTAAQRFAQGLRAVCQSLAEQIVTDGEGVKHVVELSITGAATEKQARHIARTIATSLLVKTAWAGADPNWGRLLAAAGRSGALARPEKVSIWISGVPVCHRGMAHPFDHASVHKLMQAPRYPIRIDLGSGRARATILATDLTAEYVHINADYST